MYAQQSRLIDLVEAAYRPEASYARWLDQLAELARDEVGRGEMAIAIAMSGARSGRLTTLGFGVGAASAESRTLMEAVHGQLGAMFEGLVHAGPLAGSALELVAGSSAAEALKMGLMRFGFGDVIGIVAQDGDGAVVGLAAPVRERAVINHARRTRFLRLAAHLGAAHRLRTRLLGEAAREPQAVLTPRGKVVDACGQVARERGVRSVLGEAVQHMEKARGPLRRRAPDEALALWRGLVRGTWSLVESIERDGRRFLLAHDNAVRPADPRALSSREAAVVEFVQTGLSNKLVAYTLGLSTSSVGAYLAGAMRKLGLGSRSELIALGRAPVAFDVAPFEAGLAVLSHEPPPPSSVQRMMILTPAERDVASLAARGLSNAAIAQARGRAERTVANQLAQIFQKLGVSSRAELVVALVGAPP